MRVLVCGSRDFENRKAIYALLNGLSWECTDDEVVLIEGCAPGADTMAGEWADQEIDDDDLVSHLRFPADWEKYGKRAGPIRNQQMLDEGQPDLVVAFINKPLDDSRGTANMVDKAQAAGVPVWVVRV